MTEPTTEQIKRYLNCGSYVPETVKEYAGILLKRLEAAERKLKDISEFAVKLQMNGTTERAGNELQAILEDK